MKHLGKQSKHLTVCPDLCQAWGQDGELIQHVITVQAQCQGYTWAEFYPPFWAQKSLLSTWDMWGYPGLLFSQPQHQATCLSRPLLKENWKGGKCSKLSSSIAF